MIIDTCRKEDNGKPKCALGGNCRAVQQSGKSLKSILKSRQQKYPFAYDDYNGEYDLFIVLSNPGRSDDYKGGIGFDDYYDKLIELIDKAGFDPARVWVSHITKCFSKYRKPSVKELKACLPYILKEIELTNPKVIMTLGTLPQRLFNLHNKGGVTNIRGQVFILPIPGDESGKTYKIVPSVDPDFFEYSSDAGLEKKILEDYILALNTSYNHEVKRINFVPDFEVIDTKEKFDTFVTELGKVDFFAFDTESRSLPWYKEPMICMSFTLAHNKNYVLPFYQHDPDGLDWKLKTFEIPGADRNYLRDKLAIIFENSSIAKAAHNLKYDALVLWHHLNIEIKGFLYDSMLLHHLLHEQKPHDLKYLSDIELEVGDYAVEIRKIVGVGKTLRVTYDHVPDNIMWPYTAIDTYCCFMLTKIYHKRMTPILWKLYCEETEPLIYTLIDSEKYGYPVNDKTLDQLIQIYEIEETSVRADIESYTWAGFNPSSPEQVKSALIQMGFKDKITNPKKASGFETGKNVLLALAEEGIAFPKHILHYRNVVKLLKTYLLVTKENLDYRNHVHFSFLIHGTESGRLSCKLYHQLPRPKEKGKLHTRMMLEPMPECSIVHGDYSQIELRVLAILAQDLEMIKLFKEGRDIHTATAATVLGIQEDILAFAVAEEKKMKMAGWATENRQLGKNINFGLAYGSEGHKLVEKEVWYDVGGGSPHPLTWDKFNMGMESFKERFCGVTSYLESVPVIAREQKGCYTTPFGRTRRIGKKLYAKQEGIRKAAEREIVNFSIQSPATAIMMRTILIMHNYIKQWREQGLLPENLYLLNTVHDSGDWNVANSRVDFFSKTLKIVAERPIPELSNESFECDIKIGKNYGEV